MDLQSPAGAGDSEQKRQAKHEPFECAVRQDAQAENWEEG
jgi:hypothetical protein